MQSNGASPNALFSVLLAKAARRYDPGNVDLLYIHQPAGSWLAGYRQLEKAYKEGKSKKYQKLSNYEKKLLMDFINNAVLTAYRQWVEDGRKMPMEEVIEMTNCIVLGGVNGFFK